MSPDTRPSLLLRIRDPQDHEAWNEFSEIYAPIIHRLAARKGLQSADADDLVQQVMISISKAIQTRPHDHERAKFRTWLHRVTENAILNALTRGRPDVGSGRTDFVHLLHQQEAPSDLSDLVRREREEEVFRYAAEQIRPEFEQATWQAFWKTAVDGQDCESVASELGRNVGSVYAARSRVMKRLRQRVQQFDL